MLSTEESAGTLLASAARIADDYSPEMHNNKGYKGVLIFFDVTVDDAAASVTPKIEVRNPATGEWEAYLSGTAKAAVAETSWLIYPLGLAAADLPGLATDEDQVPVPMLWRLFMDVANADSLTYSIGYQYLS